LKLKIKGWLPSNRVYWGRLSIDVDAVKIEMCKGSDIDDVALVYAPRRGQVVAPDSVVEIAEDLGSGIQRTTGSTVPITVRCMFRMNG
jgi:hypothetical protein